MYTIKLVRPFGTEIVEAHGTIRHSNSSQEHFWELVAIRMCCIEGDGNEWQCINLTHAKDDLKVPTALVTFTNKDGDLRYEPIYIGDICYIMNEQGQTVETVRSVFDATLGYMVRRFNDAYTIRELLLQAIPPLTEQQKKNLTNGKN